MRKLTTWFLSGLLVAAPAFAHAADWSVSDLMQMMRQQKTRKASFVEKKYIAALQAPLESSGELSFQAPDRLEKRIIEPKPEAVILEGDKLLLERRNGRRISVSLNDHPEVSGFVESIRATLVGDRSALEQYYDLQLDGSERDWQLLLKPTQQRMLKVISEIRIDGSGDAIRTIEFMQADGDHSVMTITDEGAP